jgi:GNAT superfamily N-acetyltransferase
VTRVRITRIGVGGLDDELAAALVAIDNAALDGVPLRHHTGRTFQLECQDRNGEGPDEAVWLARHDGELVGYAALSLNRFANLDGAKVLGAVHPDRRRRGIGRALATAAESATDRPRLRAPAGWARPVSTPSRRCPRAAAPGRGGGGTSVVHGHRGHRLGLRMKPDVLDWLRAERSVVESVDTWNAPENAPMIAINDALGCRVVAETVRFTKHRGAG